MKVLPLFCRGRRGAAVCVLVQVVAGIVVGGAPGSTNAAAPEKLASQVDQLVQPYLDGEIVNAISIGVVQDDQTWTRHYGQLSAQDRARPTDNTIYEIGSVTKVFTGILLADATYQNDLRLEQPIGELIPGLQDQNAEVADSIQLLHLATHMSGLPRMPINIRASDPANPYADYDRKQLHAFMAAVKPLRKPGQRSEYSNLAVGLLGDLLAMQADLEYDQLVQQKICKPLGMDDTRLVLDKQRLQRFAPPHNADCRPSHSWDFAALAGAGALRSTPADMLKFIKANLQPRQDQLGKAIELAWEQHLPAEPPAFAMGLGWHIARDGHTRWHNGQTGGYHTHLLIDRRSQVGVVLMCNTATMEVDRLAESIIRTVIGIKSTPREFAARPQVQPATIARLAGSYRLFPGFTLTVRADGDKLFVQATNQDEFRVYPTSDTNWRYRVVDAELTFELPAEGACTAVTLHQNGRDMRGTRIEPDGS